MRKLTLREIVLLGVVGLLGLIGWIYSRGGSFGGAATLALDPGELNYGQPPVIELTRLELHPDAFESGSRNLFRYYTPPVVAQPPPPKVERKPPPPPRQPQRPAETVKHVSTALPPRQAPRPGFRYIGFMGPKDHKIAVLAKGEEVILAELGEVVDKQFTIKEFKYEMLVLGYTSEQWADQTHELPMKR